MLKIAIIIGSTRPGRNGESVAKWVYEIAQKRTDAEFELVDIKDFNLPLLDEPVPPIDGAIQSSLTPKLGPPRSIHSMAMSSSRLSITTASAARSRTRSIFFREWNNKAAGFVSYGSAGGVRAVEHLRLVMAEVQVATVRNQVALSLFTDFENFSIFKPAAHDEKSVNQMLDQLLAWSGALKTLRVAAH